MAVTISTFQKMRDENKPIAMLTAYDYSTAKLMDEAGIDGILVGDSLGMTMLGYDNTLSVTMKICFITPSQLFVVPKTP